MKNLLFRFAQFHFTSCELRLAYERNVRRALKPHVAEDHNCLKTNCLSGNHALAYRTESGPGKFDGSKERTP
jgi:hypothetical protein